MARRLIVRGMALVYLIAIVSWWVQAPDLVGEDGLVPAGAQLERIQAYFENNGGSAFWNYPTLFHWGFSDGWLMAACLVGTVLAVLALAGVFQGPCFLLLWGIYLSLANTGGIFMSYQWDTLLQEAGLLVLFLAPWQAWAHWRTADEPDTWASRLGILLFQWLLFRLMFFSGYTKMTAGDPSWKDGTAMTYHYLTQPLPAWTAWFAHQLPRWFHVGSCWIMLMIELVVPFFIFFGSRVRWVAGLLTAGLMALIFLTGNYNFFNILTGVLCLSCFADRVWPRWLLRWTGMRVPEIPRSLGTQWQVFRSLETWPAALRDGFATVCGGAIFLVSLVVCYTQLADNPANRNPMVRFVSSKIAPFRAVNGYGLFRVMTKDRPEIVLEGSPDGVEWREYDLRWKPGPLDERPRFVAPHQPRLDWQFWFFALERRYHPQSRNAEWFSTLLVKLLNGDESAQVFFEENPFPNQPPKYLRALLYLYDFTTAEERRETGDWWKRKPQRLFLGEVSRRE